MSLSQLHYGPEVAPTTPWREAGLMLCLLLLGDLACIVLHLLWLAGVADHQYFSLEFDKGYAEFFQYLKELWIAAMLLHLALRCTGRGCWGYVVWSGLFFYLLADDAVSLHEKGGRYFADNFSTIFQPMLGLRAVDFGELVVSAAVGSITLGAVLLFYWRGNPDFQKASRHLMVLAMFLAIFGVIVDMLHMLFKGSKALYAGMGLLEDGGEMIAMSLLLWYVLLLELKNAQPCASLLKNLRTSLVSALR